MWSADVLALVLAAFFLGRMVQGVVAFGQRFRHMIFEEMFRKLFFWALLCAGLYMMVRALI